MRARAGSLALAGLLAASLGACGVERVSVGTDEQQANAASSLAAISRDGRYVAFQSGADNLAPGDTRDDDIFLRDRASGTTQLVSAAGTQASDQPQISANGRYVTFESGAKLVPGDTNDRLDVFVWDRETGATTRASVSSGETQGNEGGGGKIAINRNGRYVAFVSASTDLAPGDSNGLEDIFVRDRTAGTTIRIPAESTGEPATDTDGSKFVGLGGTAISLDGRFVAFNTIRGIPVPAGLLRRDTSDVYVRNLASGVTTRLTQGARGQARLGVAIDADGTHVAFSQGGDIVVRNLSTGAVQRVTPAATGDPQVFRLHDPQLSRTGRFLAFASDTQKNDFVQEFVNVYVADLETGKVRRVTNNPQADPAKGFNVLSGMSADGRWVVFGSNTSDLVKGDTNDVEDVFVAPGRPVR